MIDAEKFKPFLRDCTLYALARQREGSNCFTDGFCDIRFSIPEEELKSFGFPSGINSETGSCVLRIGVSQIFRQIGMSESELTDEIVSNTIDKINKELKGLEGEHLFLCFIPEIILSIEKSIEIGTAVLRNATLTDAEFLEEKADVIADHTSESERPLSKSVFFKWYNGRALIELHYSGYHFKNEISHPCDSARKEVSYIHAFLLMCKEVLQIPEKITEQNSDFYQRPSFAFFVGKHGHAPILPIYSYGSLFSRDNLAFAIDQTILDQLEKFCCLKSFNLLCRTECELRDKMFRSLDWFLKGYNEDDQTDRLVCFFISFESLMAMGGDALNSQTNDLAENIALLIHQQEAERIKEKNFFKKKVYPLRNRLMHHGHMFESKDAEISNRLMVYIIYGLIGILRHLDAIMNSGGLRGFFEKVKLSAKL